MSTTRGQGATVPGWTDSDKTPTLMKVRPAMAVARVTEITASSTKSFEDATRIGIERANKTLENVKGAWIQEQKLKIDNGKIVEYRVNMKITFILKD